MNNMAESSKLLQALQTLSKVDYFSRPRVLEKLYHSCGEECSPIYIEALKDKNPKMRIAALEILMDLSSFTDVDTIAPLINDENRRVRRIAQQFLDKLNEQIKGD